MRRRDFLASTLAAAVAAASRPLGFGGLRQNLTTRKILIAGGAYGTPFIRYMAELTGKARPKLLYLPTASADSATSTLSWYRSCAPLNVEPSDQLSFIASPRQGKSWKEVLFRSTVSSAREAIRSTSRRSGRRRESTSCCVRPGTAALSSAAPVQARCAGSKRGPLIPDRRS